MKINSKNFKVLAFSIGISIMGTACSNESEENYKQALEYSENSDYEKAVEYFEKAIEEDSQKADYYIDYGYTLTKMGNYSEAVAQFNKAILSSEENIVEPDNQITRKNNKNAYRGKAIAYFEDNDYKNAIKFFEYALEIDEEHHLDDDICSYLADAKKCSGDYEGAIEAYEKILEKSKTKDVAYAGIAQCHAMLSNTDEALEYYDKAIKEENTKYSYYFGKYNLYIQKGDEEQARKSIEDAMSIKDTSEESGLYKGEMYFITGDIEKAKPYLEEASAKGHDEALFYLGKIGLAEKNNKNAIDCFTAYVESDAGKKSAIAYKELVGLFINAKNYDKALEYMKTGLALNDKNTQRVFKFFEVAIYEGKGEFEKAFELALEYLNDYPDDNEMQRELQFLITRTGGGDSQ